MLNKKIYKTALDFSKPVAPREIPGNTLEEKAAYISQYLEEKLVDDFLSKRITEEQVYQLVTDRQIESSAGFEFLEQYRTNLEDLRKKAGKLIRSEGVQQPTDMVVDKIVERLLQRAGTVFIPQLVKIYRLKTQRAEKVIEPLLQYKDPQEVVAIQNFIRSEVKSRKDSIVYLFEDINKAAKLFNPKFTTEHLIFMLENDLTEIAANDQIPLTPEQASEIKGRLDILDRDVMQMNAKNRLWNRILEVHPDIPNRDAWAALIPENLRIKWSLLLILREYDYEVSRTDENRRRITEETITETRARSGDDSIYFYFFPDTDDLGNPIETEENKRIYALSKLKESVENGYDNERIFDAIGVTITFTKEQKEKLREETTPSESAQEEAVYEETGSRVSTERDKTGARINYWFKFQTKRDRSKGTAEAVEAFRDDLREAGLYGVAKILSMFHRQPEDSRYEEWDLKFLSVEEMNMCNRLRNDFGLDPIPFPVKIPCPIDNPTTKDKFIIDFLLPCDVLVGFEVQETSEFVDENTGEVISEIIRKPIIERKVIFIGEYFGWRHTMKKEIQEWSDGREWCNPDGSLPVYRYESKNQTYIVAPGQDCREVEFYDLKSKWKVFTTEVIGDILGTRTLSFNRDDLRAAKGRSIMNKLDAAKIIYHSSLCTPDYGCKAVKEIEKFSTITPEIQKYVDPNYFARTFDDPKEKALRLVECAISNVKLVDVLYQAKREFTPLMSDDPNEKLYNLGGFNRLTMYAHQQRFEKIRNEIDILNKSLEQKPIKKETYEQTVEKRRKVIERIEELESQLYSLTSSPLFDFKQFVDSLIDTEADESQLSEPAIKLKKLYVLKQQIENGNIPSMLQLKREILEIDDSLIGQFSREYLRDE